MTQLSTTNIVCGPPDTPHRYVLVEHIASGGQAEVYRGERVSDKLPVVVKVFRLRSGLSRQDQMHLWESGDTVLEDLSRRGMTHICSRVESFFAAPPQLSGEEPATDPDLHVPYQVLEFIPGRTLPSQLREGERVNAVAVLRSLAAVLQTLHYGLHATHGDISPSNVVISNTGAARLIDFTSARHVSMQTDEAVQAFQADIFGFGVIAYAMVTGEDLRRGRATPLLPGAETGVAGDAHILAEHPLLDAHLRRLLSAGGDGSIGAHELGMWIDQLAELMKTVEQGRWLVQWPLSRQAQVDSSLIAAQLPVAMRGEPVRRGQELVVFGAAWCSLAWLCWFFADLWDTQSLTATARTTLLALGVTCVLTGLVHWLTRLAGYVLRQSFDRGPRRSTLLPNVTVALFLLVAGIAFLTPTPLNPIRVVNIVAETW